MNIFVAKLDYSTTVDTVRELFEQYGEVSEAKIVMDRETGRSKGFGFIEMDDEEEGKNAINDLNGTHLDGREIVVKKSEPRENNNRGGGGGGGGGYRKRFDRNDNRGGGGGNRYDSRDSRGGGGDRFNRRDDNRGNNDRNNDRNNRW